MVTIVTTYLKGRKQAQVLEVLNRLKVNIVLDVRWWASMPWEYSPHIETLRPPLTPFKLFLGQNNIEYYYEHELGFPSKKRKELINTPVTAQKYYQTRVLTYSSAKSVFEKYVWLMLTKWKTSTICLICSCPTEDKAMCHRFWLVELFETRLANLFDPHVSSQK